MKPILQTIPSSGTSTGIHWWLSWLSCARRAHLSMQHDDANETNESFMVGTLVHAFLARYFSKPNFRNQNPSLVEFRVDGGDTMEIPEVARLEAERLFRAFRIRHDPEFFGEVLEVEKDRLAKLFAAQYELTFRPDLETKVGKVAAKKMSTQMSADITPGIYLIDHKTAAGERSYLSWMQNPQFTAYMLGYENQTGVRPNGMIVNIIYKRKEVDFLQIVVPFPGDAQIAVLKEAMDQSFRLQHEQRPPCNITQCFSSWNGQPCRFLESGLCERY